MSLPKHLQPWSLDEVERRIVGSDSMVFDAETEGLDWRQDKICGWVLGFSPRIEDTTYLPVRHKGNEGRGNLDPAKVLECVRGAVRKNPRIRLKGFNLAFDLRFLFKEGLHFDEFKMPFEDGMINAFLIYELQPGFSLDACCRYMKVTEKKGDELYAHLAQLFGGEPGRQQMQHFHKTAADDPIAVDYATGDSISTWELIEAQQARLDEPDHEGHSLREIWDIECRTIRALVRMETRGIKVDETRLHQVRRIVDEQLQLAKRKLPKDFNPKAPTQMIKLFTDAGYRKEQLPKTAKGNPSFTEGWLSSNPLGQAVIAARKLQNLESSFLRPLIERHLWKGRVHTTFNQTRGEDFGTITGRLSSSNPNMQQVHKRNMQLGALFRSIFVPDEGRVVTGADYNQCLVAGTQVMVPGGTKNIEDMRPGDLVYSYDNSRRLCLRRVTWAGQTGVRSVCRVRWMTNGRTYGHLDVTPDHRIRLIDGTYRTVEELANMRNSRKGRHPYSIRVLALRRSRVRVGKKEDGYYRNYVCITGTERVAESRFVFEQVNGWSPQVVHHKDGDSTNDDPTNLEGLTHKEHLAHHGVYGMKDLSTSQRKERSMIATRALQRKFRLINNHIITHIVPLPGEVPVYDITVEGTHNFIANEICVHNCEPRLLAHFAEVKLLIDGYLSDPPIDAHSMVAKGAKIERQAGKTLNQALLTGAGETKAASMLGLPMKDAMKIVDAYFDSMPEIKPFQRNVMGVFKDRGYLVSLLGRRMHLDDPRFAYRGGNRILQGGNADIIKASMARIDEMLAHYGFETEMLLNVHDDIVYQHPEGDESLLNRALEIMKDYGPDGQSVFLSVPMEVDAKSGANWAEASYGKDAVRKVFESYGARY